MPHNCPRVRPDLSGFCAWGSPVESVHHNHSYFCISDEGCFSMSYLTKKKYRELQGVLTMGISRN